MAASFSETDPIDEDIVLIDDDDLEESTGVDDENNATDSADAVVPVRGVRRTAHRTSVGGGGGSGAGGRAGMSPSASYQMVDVEDVSMSNLKADGPLVPSGSGYMRPLSVSTQQCDRLSSSQDAGVGISSTSSWMSMTWRMPEVSLMTVVVFLAAMGGFLFGYDLGLVSGALEYIEEDLHLSEWQDELIVMAAKAGAFFGTFIGGAAMLAYGRRPCIACSAIFFIAGPVMMAAAANATLLVVGRFSIGIGIGVSAVVVPAYLGELSPAHLRGRIVAVYEVAVALGMFVAPLVDFTLKDLESQWRYMVSMPLIPAVMLMLAVLLLPESPRWLVMIGMYDEALQTLQSLRKTPGARGKGERWQGQGHRCREAKSGRSQASRGRIRDRSMDKGAQAGDDERTSLSPCEPTTATNTNTNGAVVAETTKIIAEDELMEIWSTDQKNKASASEMRSALQITIGSSSKQRRPTIHSLSDEEEQAAASTDACSSSSSAAMPRTLMAAMTEMMMDFRELTRGDDRSAFCMAMWLALVNQLCASTAIINYGPKLLDKIGTYDRDERILMTVVLALVKMIGIVIGMLLVDKLGRRPLLVNGSAGMCASLVCLSAGAAGESSFVVLASIYSFMFSFSVSWAGIFWVLMSEMFSMRIKSAAASAATAVLFAGGAAMDGVFLTVYTMISYQSFLLYAAVSLAGGMYVYTCLPETKCLDLNSIQKAFKRHNDTMRYGCPTFSFFRAARDYRVRAATNIASVPSSEQVAAIPGDTRDCVEDDESLLSSQHG